MDGPCLSDWNKSAEKILEKSLGNLNIYSTLDDIRELLMLAVVILCGYGGESQFFDF